MKNMNTTLEIPEGSKATIQGKVIDGKNYLAGMHDSMLVVFDGRT